MILQNKSIVNLVVFGSLLSSSILPATSATNPPRNTLADVTAQSLSLVGSSYPNTPYSGQVAPSISKTIENAVDDYESGQLTPRQMQRLKEIELERQRITASAYTTPAREVVRSISPDLAPGKQPPVIRVSKDVLTSVVFTDLQGNPWYIEQVVLNRNKFSDSAGLVKEKESEGEKPKPTNILTLEPNTAIEYGNVLVKLEGKALPVIFMLTSGQHEVDVRVDARMKGVNPALEAQNMRTANNPMAAGASLIGRVDNSLDTEALGFLDGVIPEGAQPLISSDGSMSGWYYNDSLYVRTMLDVLHPAPISYATSPDNHHIYKFEGRIPTATFLQRGGQPVTTSFTEVPYSYDIF